MSRKELLVGCANASTELVYIMGRGRSGSTVIDAILGNSEELLSIGEVIMGLNNPHETCSTGTRVSDDPFWGRVIANVESKTGLSIRTVAEELFKFSHLKNFPRILFTRELRGKDEQKLLWHRILYETLAHNSSKSKIVDSSKELSRALFLGRFYPNVKLVHLVRDPVRFVSSYRYRIQNGIRFHFLRIEVTSKLKQMPFLTFPFLCLVAMSWLIGNLLAELASIRSGRKTFLLHYERFCMEPGKTVRLLGDFLGADLGDIATKLDKGSCFEVGCILGGNEWRLKSGNTFEFRPSAGSRHSVPIYVRLMVTAICWPLMLKYGYLSRRISWRKRVSARQKSMPS